MLGSGFLASHLPQEGDAKGRGRRARSCGGLSTTSWRSRSLRTRTGAGSPAWRLPPGRDPGHPRRSRAQARRRPERAGRTDGTVPTPAYPSQRRGRDLRARPGPRIRQHGTASEPQFPPASMRPGLGQPAESLAVIGTVVAECRRRAETRKRRQGPPPWPHYPSQCRGGPPLLCPPRRCRRRGRAALPTVTAPSLAAAEGG